DTALVQSLKQGKRAEQAKAGGQNRPAKRGKPTKLPGEKSLAASPGTWFVWAGIVAFFVFLFGIILSVLVDSLGKPWFTTWLPEHFTVGWYQEAWTRFDLTHIIVVTLVVAVTVVVVSILVGVPAAYVLARRNFRSSDS